MAASNHTITDILSESICLELGFKKLPHFTVADNLIYDLDRNRHLSIGCVGTPNETLFICESDSEYHKNITDVVCLHNYDYDGYLSKSKLEALIQWLDKSYQIKQQAFREAMSQVPITYNDKNYDNK